MQTATQIPQPQREALLNARRNQVGIWDFAPAFGDCLFCGFDLVEHHGKEYPRADITGCPKCHRSYCE